MKRKTKKASLKSLPLPKVIPRSNYERPAEMTAFPLAHYSYSSFTKFSSDPFMFRVNYVNGESIETTTSATSVLGSAVHRALQVYLGGTDIAVPVNDGEAIKISHEQGIKFLNDYQDGFIRYTSDIKHRAQLMERFAFVFFAYLKEFDYKKTCKEVLLVEKMLKHQIEVDGKVLPVPLKGSADLVYLDFNDSIEIVDHKIVTAYSKPDAIDGAKLLQAAFNYFTVYAELGRPPDRMKFRECKFSKNQDGSPQTREYTIEFAKHPLIFDFFFRFYQDVTDALLGKQVFVPNVYAMYDREVSVLAYIHRLDIDEEKAKAFKQAKVSNITDFLKKRIQKDAHMKRFMETVSTKFISAQTLNYKDMKIEDRIKMKLAEHGIGVEFDSAVVGPTVTLYRFDPTVGVKMTRLEQFAKDIELVTKSTGVRILAPIPGTDLIGFEVPNTERTFAGKAPHAQNLRIPIGVDINGETRYIELREAPHVLIAGTSGAGKSVTLNSILSSIGGTADLWLMDPKQVELSDIPCERYSDTIRGIMKMLKELTGVIEERYTSMKEAKQKSWTSKPIVAVVDEFADLTMQSKEGFIEWELCERHEAYDERSGGDLRRVLMTKKRLRVKEQDMHDAVASCEHCKKHVYPPAEQSIQRIAQMGRAAGIHMIIATQSPRVDVITGSIKANFPTRIALRTASPTDSEVILGTKGAEKLCGKGDMLLMTSTDSNLTRLQGFSN